MIFYLENFVENQNLAIFRQNSACNRFTKMFENTNVNLLQTKLIRLSIYQHEKNIHCGLSMMSAWKDCLERAHSFYGSISSGMAWFKACLVVPFPGTMKGLLSLCSTGQEHPVPLETLNIFTRSHFLWHQWRSIVYDETSKAALAPSMQFRG